MAFIDQQLHAKRKPAEPSRTVFESLSFARAIYHYITPMKIESTFAQYYWITSGSSTPRKLDFNSWRACQEAP